MIVHRASQEIIPPNSIAAYLLKHIPTICAKAIFSQLAFLLIDLTIYTRQGDLVGPTSHAHKESMENENGIKKLLSVH